MKASVVAHKTGLTEGAQGAILTIRDYLVVCEGGGEGWGGLCLYLSPAASTQKQKLKCDIVFFLLET